MSDIIILMRHGKAKRPQEGEPDFDRTLTEHGRRSLAATLPTALGLLPKNAKMEVWSSPASRAEETARLMRKACARHGADVAPDIVLVDALWSQDADAFLEAARACEADIVVAVGHNPFIEDLTKGLTGSYIDFATGGFAAIALEGRPVAKAAVDSATALDDSPEVSPPSFPVSGAVALEAGRLLWFSQGPVSQRWETLVDMEKVLAKAADTVAARIEAFFADPEDIETLHKVRTSIRTLRSLLAFVRPWQDAGQNASVQSALKEIVVETSRQRELDVLCEQAQAMEGASPELVEFCAALAADERGRVMETLSSKRAVKLLGRVAKELHAVRWRRRAEVAGLTEADVRSRFDELVSALEADLAALDLSDVERTHDVRKDAKRVRYDAEQFSKLLGDEAVDIAKGMTAHQDSLGAICDARVNIAIINELDTEGLPERVTWDLALLRAQNETFLYTALRGA